MKKKRYFLFVVGIIVLLLIVLGFKLFNIYSLSTFYLFSSYQGFEIEGDTIVNYTNKGGNVVIPDMINGVVITKIGDNAFNGLDIDSVIIPDSIVEIGDYAFANNNIVSLKLTDSVSKIGEGAFMHNLLEKIEISSKTELGNACFNDNLLEYDNSFFYKKDSDNSELISYGGKVKGNVEIDNDNLKIIGAKAFLETNIISILIPKSVIKIESEAFKGNYLVEMYLSNNIEEIAEEAFSDNDYLTEVVVDNMNNSLLNYPWGADNSNFYWLKK